MFDGIDRNGGRASAQYEGAEDSSQMSRRDKVFACIRDMEGFGESELNRQVVEVRRSLTSDIRMCPFPTRATTDGDAWDVTHDEMDHEILVVNIQVASVVLDVCDILKSWQRMIYQFLSCCQTIL